MVVELTFHVQISPIRFIITNDTNIAQTPINKGFQVILCRCKLCTFHFSPYISR